jgi:hypothetical protein
MTLSSLYNVFSDVDPSASGDFAVVRGGDFSIIEEGLSNHFLATYIRFSQHIAPMPSEDMRSPWWGFRCVRPPQQP